MKPKTIVSTLTAFAVTVLPALAFADAAPGPGPSPSCSLAAGPGQATLAGLMVFLGAAFYLVGRRRKG